MEVYNASGRQTQLAPLFALSDFLLVLASGWLAYTLRFGETSLPPHFSRFTFSTGLTIVFVFFLAGIYESYRGKGLLSLLRKFSTRLLSALFIVLSVLIFTKSAEEFSRLWLGYFFFCYWFFGASLRTAIYLLFKQIRKRGQYLKRVIAITSKPNLSSRFVDSMQQHGYAIYELIPVNPNDKTFDRHKLLKKIDDLSASEVWLMVPLRMGELIKNITYELRNHTVNIRYLPDFEDTLLLNHKANFIGGVFALDISCTPMDGSNFVIKRLEDLFLGSLIALLITPLCLIIAAMIKLTSEGPVLFKQYRTGIDGKRIKVYKFRSMKVHQEAQGAVTQASRKDPRITPLGAFLRKTSLDELPQFYNVLQGRMSIVGPRPHALAHNEYYKDLVESYMWRHKVKPGITGLAQVRGYRGETDTLEKMQKRVELDLEYINNWSIWLDIKIITLTIIKGFINKNAY